MHFVLILTSRLSHSENFQRSLYVGYLSEDIKILPNISINGSAVSVQVLLRSLRVVRWRIGCHILRVHVAGVAVLRRRCGSALPRRHVV